jgi:hypothetical protein
MSLASSKKTFAQKLLINSLTTSSSDYAIAFSKAFTSFFKNASLNGIPIVPNTESLPVAVGVLCSGVTLAFRPSDKQETCKYLQEGIQNYWAKEDPTTHQQALGLMWPDCTPPAIVEASLTDFLIPALDRQFHDDLGPHLAIADALCNWLTTSVKVYLPDEDEYFYFV